MMVGYFFGGSPGSSDGVGGFSGGNGGSASGFGSLVSCTIPPFATTVARIDPIVLPTSGIDTQFNHSRTQGATMGGRGDTSKSFNENKIVSNIDAPRNKPFRDARAKEIEVGRAAQVAVVMKPKQSRTSKKIIEKNGTVSALMPGKLDGRGDRIFERRSIPSVAQSGDGVLHVTKHKKSWFVSDAVSGLSVREYSSKSKAIGFMNSLVRKDGTTSPTLRRYLNNVTDSTSFKKPTRASDAFLRFMQRRRNAGLE
jgi:hypothetical protein